MDTTTTTQGAKTMSKQTQAAIRKYTQAVCERAYALSRRGEGPATVALYTGLHFNSANAAIDAGREIAGK